MYTEKYDFNYNVSLKTINCINGIDCTYHVSNKDYPIHHLHKDYLEFTILTKGIIENNHQNSKDIIEQDTLFITQSNIEHYFIKKSEEITFINIICRNSFLSKISELLNYNLSELFYEKNIFKLPEELIFTIKSNIAYVNSLKEEEWEICNSILKSTVIQIVNYIYLDNLKTKNSKEKWENIMNELKQNPDFYSYNVNELCEKLGYSRTQLNRIFMNKYNMSPYEYLKDLKMKYAKSLLSHTDYSVSEISQMVGYTNLNQFNKYFKEKFGILPLEYKKQN